MLDGDVRRIGQKMDAHHVSGGGSAEPNHGGPPSHGRALTCGALDKVALPLGMVGASAQAARDALPKAPRLLVMSQRAPPAHDAPTAVIRIPTTVYPPGGGGGGGGCCCCWAAGGATWL